MYTLGKPDSVIFTIPGEIPCSRVIKINLTATISG